MIGERLLKAYMHQKREIFLLLVVIEMILQFGENWHPHAAQKQGISGTVVYGASRDIIGIKKS